MTAPTIPRIFISSFEGWDANLNVRFNTIKSPLSQPSSPKKETTKKNGVAWEWTLDRRTDDCCCMGPSQYNEWIGIQIKLHFKVNVWWTYLRFLLAAGKKNNSILRLYLIIIIGSLKININNNEKTRTLVYVPCQPSSRWCVSRVMRLSH